MSDELFNSIPTDDQLDSMEAVEDGFVMTNYDYLDKEDVSYLSALCDDTTMDAYMRKYLIEYNDTTGSKSSEELYMRQVIMGNNKTLEGLAKRQMEYEQQLWKEQETAADML